MDDIDKHSNVHLLTHAEASISHTQTHTQVSSKQTSTQMRLYKLKIPLLPLVVDEEAEVAHQVLPFLYINP